MANNIAPKYKTGDKVWFWDTIGTVSEGFSLYLRNKTIKRALIEYVDIIKYDLEQDNQPYLEEKLYATEKEALDCYKEWSTKFIDKYYKDVKDTHTELDKQWEMFKNKLNKTVKETSEEVV
jgi:hypothetical protein